MTDFSCSTPIPAALAALSLLLALAACQEPAGTTAVDDTLRELEADQVIYGMSTYATTDGVRQAQIRADTAFVFRDSSVVHLKGVDMTIYGETGTVRATVTASTGRMDRRSEMLTARGDVLLRIPAENRVVEGPELHYDPSGDRIWSDSATTLRDGGRVTRGTCFQSDLQFRNYTICNLRGSAGGITPPGGGGGGG